MKFGEVRKRKIAPTGSPFLERRKGVPVKKKKKVLREPVLVTTNGHLASSRGVFLGGKRYIFPERQKNASTEGKEKERSCRERAVTKPTLLLCQGDELDKKEGKGARGVFFEKKTFLYVEKETRGKGRRSSDEPPAEENENRIALRNRGKANFLRPPVRTGSRAGENGEAAFLTF